MKRLTFGTGKVDPLFLIIIVISTALLFDFLNGFHDAANSIATIVATGVLTPFLAVLWAAFFNFIAFLFFHMEVANTMGAGLVTPTSINTYIIFSGLLGAILVNLITWYFGLPASSSHALIGGIVGAAVIKQGWQVVELAGILKVLIAIVVSPLLGLLISYSLLVLIQRLLTLVSGPNYSTKSPWTKRFQLFSASLLSIGHGGNDAQKTMGIIALLLFTNHIIGPSFYVPFWIILACNLVMALGTLAGGWRIVRTLGEKITKLDSLKGATAETASAIVLFMATSFGIPISTTYTVTGAITGVGLSKHSFINWILLHNIIWAWIFTMPVAGLVAAIISYFLNPSLIG